MLYGMVWLLLFCFGVCCICILFVLVCLFYCDCFGWVVWLFVCVIIWRLGLVVTVLLIVLDGVICMHIARRYVCIGLCVLIGRLYLVVVWLGLICVCLFV